MVDRILKSNYYITMLVLGDTLSGFVLMLFKRIICKKTHGGIWQHGESLSISAT